MGTNKKILSCYSAKQGRGRIPQQSIPQQTQSKIFVDCDCDDLFIQLI